MNKKAFIQACAIQCLPDMMQGKFGTKDEEPVMRVIRASERLWEGLCDQGYGDAKKRELAPSDGYYASLKPPMKVIFDRFWAAYHEGGLKKHDRDKAVKAMLEVKGLPDDERLAETIIAAAAMDAAYYVKHPEKSRKYAQGWVSARCWEDYEVGKVVERTKSAGKAALLAGLNGDIQALLLLGADKPGSPLAGQLQDARARYETAKHGD